MKKFHITVTENETGKTYIDTDTDAIIAGVNLDDTVSIVGHIHCTKTDHAFLIDSLRESLLEQENKDPALAILLGVLKVQKDLDAQKN